MSSAIYQADNTEDEFVKKLKKELIEADNGQNSDIYIIFQGYLHNKTGFKLRIENIEVFTDGLIDDWKAIIQNHGLQCDVTADLANAWVNLTCKRILRHRKSIREKMFLPSMKCPRIPLSLIGYLTLILISIYLLWIRHKERLVK